MLSGFLAGTQITLDSGLSNIEDVIILNSLVITHKNNLKTITSLQTSIASNVKKLDIENHSSLYASNDSIFLVLRLLATNNTLPVVFEWVTLRDLKTNDYLVSPQLDTLTGLLVSYNFYRVSNISDYLGDHEVYNLTIEDDHSYIADGISVRN